MIDVAFSLRDRFKL